MLHFTLWELIQAKRRRVRSEQPLAEAPALSIPAAVWETQPGAEFCPRDESKNPEEMCKESRPSTQYQFLSLLSYLLMKAAQGKCQKPRIKQLERKTSTPSSIFMMLRSGDELKLCEEGRCQGRPATTNSAVTRKQ